MTHYIHPIRFSLSIVFGLLLLLAGCDVDKFSAPPQSFGNLHQIVVVCDTDLWESAAGDSLRYYLAPPYPVLPQPEPVFDLRHFTQDEMDADSDRLRFRHILYLADMGETGHGTAFAVKKIVGEENIRRMMSTDEKSDIKVSRNRWAVGQTILFLYAENENALVDAIRNKSASIAQTFGEKDQKMLRNRVYIGGKNGKATKTVQENLGIKLAVPGDYQVAINDEKNNFVWLRNIKPNSHIHTNIMAYTFPYEGGELTAEEVKQMRDSLTKKYVISGEVENSYMRVDDVHLPLYSETASIDGAPATLIRGIWQMSATADMMGGAFVSYAIQEPNQNRIIFLDGFAYAPGEKKRDLIMGLDLVLKNTVLE